MIARFKFRPSFAMLAASLVLATTAAVWHLALYGQSVEGYPDGFDAAAVAPASHHVVFENKFIRVLQVTLPPVGHAEPMHFHRWPSLFLGYDTGGKTAHLRYHTPDGKVRDQPSINEPVHAGVWSAEWMRPEPMHSIETVEDASPGPGAPPGWLRVEIKCALK